MLNGVAATLVLFAVLASLVALFLLYSVSLWLSQDPEKAFLRAAYSLHIFSKIWDFEPRSATPAWTCCR